MRILRIALDVNHYQYFLTVNDEDSECLYMDGTPRKDTWTPPEVFILYPKHLVGDFFQFGGAAPIASPKAAHALRAFSQSAGELLPLPYNGETYTILNVLNIVDCLDAPRLEHAFRSRSRYLLRAGGIEMLRQSPSVLFKVPQAIRAAVHVVEGLRDPVDEFRAVVARAGLKGLLFQEVWSDQKG